MSLSLSRIDKFPIALDSSLSQLQDSSVEMESNNNKYQSEPIRSTLIWQRIDSSDNE